MTHNTPYDIRDATEQLAGTSVESLTGLLSGALDRIYQLRTVNAWAVLELRRALKYRGFSKSRRQIAESQMGWMTRLAHGDTDQVVAERDSLGHVRWAIRAVDFDEDLLATIPIPDDANLVTASTPLREGTARAYKELLTLRQLAFYEATVTANHSTASSPKAVRRICDQIALAFSTAAHTGRADLPDVDAHWVLDAVGADTTLTVSRYLTGHGLDTPR